MKSNLDVLELQSALRSCETKRELQRIMCVWLRILFSLNSKQIAAAIGWTPEAVRRVQSQAARHGIQYFREKTRGGRRRELISFDREEQILSKFARQAQSGGVLNISELRRAYELSVGKSVSLSTVYRLISRHGLRRFLPRARRSRMN